MVDQPEGNNKVRRSFVEVQDQCLALAEPLACVLWLHLEDLQASLPGFYQGIVQSSDCGVGGEALGHNPLGPCLALCFLEALSLAAWAATLLKNAP